MAMAMLQLRHFSGTQGIIWHCEFFFCFSVIIHQILETWIQIHDRTFSNFPFLLTNGMPSLGVISEVIIIMC